MSNETIAAPEQTSKPADGKSELIAGLGVNSAGYYWWRETNTSRWMIADVWKTNWGFVAHMHDGCRADFISKKGGEFVGPIPTPNAEITGSDRSPS